MEIKEIAERLKRRGNYSQESGKLRYKTVIITDDEAQAIIDYIEEREKAFDLEPQKHGCGSCVYGYRNVDEIPCVTCKEGKGYTDNWQPKTK